MFYQKPLLVPAQKLAQYDSLCQYADSSVEKDRAIFDEEVVFSTGVRMAIQVVSPLTPANEPCWTQGVLFDADGCELGCTDVGESLSGEFTVDYAGDTYEVCVQARDA